MATKKYKQQESEPSQVNEPAEAYQKVRTMSAESCALSEYEREIIMRSERDIAEGRVYSQEEVDKMIDQWLI